jgi:hypothetical protein
MKFITLVNKFYIHLYLICICDINQLDFIKLLDFLDFIYTVVYGFLHASNVIDTLNAH